MKDLRKDFNWGLPVEELPKGHRDRFKSKLPKQNHNFHWMKIAAILTIAILSGIITFQNADVFNTGNSIVQEEPKKKSIDLKDISPELATLEGYYEASIQLEIASLNNSEAYQEMIKSYFDELKALEDEYGSLKNQLTTIGARRSIIQSMIENLKMRLELLQELDQRINELNQMENENNQNNTI